MTLHGKFWIKCLLVEFGIAFFLGIVGLWVTGSIFVAMGGGLDTIAFVWTLFIGVPLGSAFGIFVAKHFVLRTTKFSVFSILCLLISVICGYLAGRYLWPAVYPYIRDLIGLGATEAIVFPLITLFALVGYHAIEVLFNPGE